MVCGRSLVNCCKKDSCSPNFVRNSPVSFYIDILFVFLLFRGKFEVMIAGWAGCRYRRDCATSYSCSGVDFTYMWNFIVSIDRGFQIFLFHALIGTLTLDQNSIWKEFWRVRPSWLVCSPLAFVDRPKQLENQPGNQYSMTRCRYQSAPNTIKKP